MSVYPGCEKVPCLQVLILASSSCAFCHSTHNRKTTVQILSSFIRKRQVCLNMADLCSDHDIFDPLDDSSCAQEINFSFLEETDSSSEYDVCDISEDEEHLNFEKQSGDRRGRPKGTKRKADFSEQCQPRKKHQKVPLQQLNCYGCCILLCMSLIPIEDLERLRTFTANLSVTELSNWVLDLLWLHKSENTQFCYMLGEWRMCTAAFLLTIGMPLTTFYSIRKKFKAGVKEIDKRGKPVGKTTPKVQTATVWLIEYANKYADKLPNSTKLHLPSCLTKDSIYNIMTEELEDKEEEIVSKSHFYYIWRTCLSHIAIPPTSRFSKCNTCSKIKTQLGETKDKTKRKQLISLRQKHLMKQRYM
ncbi:uncharacterized protein LOC128550135 isoform X2 [Mercenaria mercenaria]|uniref:uncharacterized protein LOC128550135 isoform X2 n=1 Tax=Mercenaria mercenaria TaxID=6596 RepID=UPI00234E4E5E|nr:uncharacterized protein LOC128550135 isoform X2 [Mercenaria mercenaria]